MIVCPNCNHQNPEGAGQCEACYTPLPAMTSCPNCGATVQTDATFCGQCGFNLRAAGVTSAVPDTAMSNAELPNAAAIAATAIPDMPESEVSKLKSPKASILVEPAAAVPSSTAEILPDLSDLAERAPDPVEVLESVAEPPPSPDPAIAAEVLPSVEPAIATAMEPSIESRTQLQQQSARLIHVQTNTTVDLPPSLTVIHIGKPNDRIPPDIDVSGFPNSEIVSRIHADIRLEGEAYYVEDVGSSNGTYINNLPLAIGNRHRLRPGDRVGLGKGDKVTFLFQLS